MTTIVMTMMTTKMMTMRRTKMMTMRRTTIVIIVFWYQLRHIVQQVSMTTIMDDNDEVSVRGIA